MSFWRNIGSLSGTTNIGIYLQGSLAYQAGEPGSSPQGGIDVVTSYGHYNSSPYVVFSNDVFPNATRYTIERVYWLPWLNNEITSVSIADLNRSGCDYFLTSTFSGCRFVSTDTLVAHVAFHQGIFGSDSVGRDLSETFLHNVLSPSSFPQSRRKMSISGSNGMCRPTTDVIYGHPAAADPNPGRAVVVGRKLSDNSWQFKALTYDNGSLPTWRSLS